MPRPTTKPDLVEAANEQFDKLWKVINSLSEEEQSEQFLFEDRDQNLRDVLVHLYEWHRMVESWHQVGTLEGGMPDVPGKGYTWKTLPDLNMEIWKKHQHISRSPSKQMLHESHEMILRLIQSHTND